MTGSAQAQQCFVEICKSAPEAGPEQGFTFLIDNGSMIGIVELFDGGDCFTESFFAQETDLEIVEEPAPGFELVDVVCDPSEGFSISAIPGGIDVDCTTANEASTTCTFFNARATANIPTLSQWGTIAAAGGLLLVGAFYAVRRRKAAA